MTLWRMEISCVSRLCNHRFWPIALDLTRAFESMEFFLKQSFVATWLTSFMTTKQRKQFEHSSRGCVPQLCWSPTIDWGSIQRSLLQSCLLTRAAEVQALPGYEAFIYGKGITKKHKKSNQVNDWVDQELVGPSCTYSVLQSPIATSRPSFFFICSSCTSSFIVPRLWLASNCVFVADIDQFECAIDPLKTIHHLPASTVCILIDLILCGR